MTPAREVRVEQNRRHLLIALALVSFVRYSLERTLPAVLEP